MLLGFGLFSAHAQSGKVKLISPEKLSKKLDKGIQLIDVRTLDEFNAGAIDGATNIDVLSANFASKVAVLNKRKAVYVYCKSGKRSASAAAKLAEMGFKKIRDLEGGYQKWQTFRQSKK